MALTKLTTDLNIIQALVDEPNDVGGLTAAQLKAKFDEGTNDIKTYMNNTLTSEIDSTLATKAEVQAVVLGQIPDGSLTKTKMATAVQDSLNKADSALQSLPLHAHGNLTNDGKIGSTADLPVFTAESGAVATKSIADAKTLLGISAPFYEKIRDIADTSGTTSLSISLSDIDWSVWREIRLIGKVGLSTMGAITYRVNSLSANYLRTYTVSGSAASAAASTNSIYAGTATTGNLANSPSLYDISILQKIHYDGRKYYCFVLNRILDSTNAVSGVASCGDTIPTLSTFNIISVTAGYTVSIADTSLWGIRV